MDKLSWKTSMIQLKPGGLTHLEDPGRPSQTAPPVSALLRQSVLRPPKIPPLNKASHKPPFLCFLLIQYYATNKWILFFYDTWLETFMSAEGFGFGLLPTKIRIRKFLHK